MTRRSLAERSGRTYMTSTMTSTAFARPHGLHLSPQRRPAAPTETPVHLDPCSLLNIMLQPRGSAKPEVIQASALWVPVPTRSDVSLPTCLSGRPGLTWLEEAGGRGAEGNPRALGSLPQWPRDARGCSCVLCSPWELGAVVSESVQGWRQGSLLGGGVSGQSRGREPGGEAQRANVRTTCLGWSHWARETRPRTVRSHVPP